jgi:hypothetical protein
MGFTVPTEFPKAGAKYEPIPPDNHLGILIGWIDLGTHMESYQGGPLKANRKVKLQWELPGVSRSDGSTAVISAKYNFSLHEKASFRKVLDAWMGADWPTRFKGQSFEFLLLQPALVLVEQNKDKDDPTRVFSFVKQVGRVPKGMPVPEPTKSTFWLDLDAKLLPEKLSFYDAQAIRESNEFKAGGFRDDAPKPDGRNGNGNGANGHGPHALPPPTTMPHPDDDDNAPPF